MVEILHPSQDWVAPFETQMQDAGSVLESSGEPPRECRSPRGRQVDIAITCSIHRDSRLLDIAWAIDFKPEFRLPEVTGGTWAWPEHFPPLVLRLVLRCASGGTGRGLALESLDHTGEPMRGGLTVIMIRAVRRATNL